MNDGGFLSRDTVKYGEEPKLSSNIVSVLQAEAFLGP